MLLFLEKYGEKFKQKKESSKSATDTEENPAEGTSSTTVDVSDDYLSLIKTSFEVNKTFNVFKTYKLTKKKNKIVKWIETKTEKLSQKIIDNLVDAKFDDIIALAIVCYNLGQMYTDEDRGTTAEKYFMRCAELLNGRELDRKAILLAVEVYLILSSIMVQHNNMQKSYEFLIKALQLYSKYKENYLETINIARVLGIERLESNTDDLDTLHTLILTCLSELYELNPGDKHEYVEYMHKFLQKIINADQHCTFAFSSIVAELSRYFLQHNRITEAHNHLAIASSVGNKFFLATSTCEDMVNSDFIYQRSSLCVKLGALWAEYAIILLRISKHKFLRREEDNDPCQTSNTEEKFPTKFKKPTNLLLFFYVHDEIQMLIPNMTDKYVSQFYEVERIIRLLLKWRRMSIIHYNKNPKDMLHYGKIIASICAAYKYFVCFVPNNTKELYKKKIYFIETEITYLVNLKFDTYKRCIIKIMWLEHAIANSILFDTIQEDFVSTDKKETPEILMDMQSLLDESIKSFKKYFSICSNSISHMEVIRNMVNCINQQVRDYQHITLLLKTRNTTLMMNSFTSL